MRDHDDGAYIVIEREGGGVGTFILGALVGAAVGRSAAVLPTRTYTRSSGRVDLTP